LKDANAVAEQNMNIMQKAYAKVATITHGKRDLYTKEEIGIEHVIRNSNLRYHAQHVGKIIQHV